MDGCNNCLSSYMLLDGCNNCLSSYMLLDGCNNCLSSYMLLDGCNNCLVIELHVVVVVWFYNNGRDDDFPFQKIAFSVWENSEFRFKGLSKWKFRLAIDTVHKNSVYKRHTHYESGYFQRVTWSVSHCDIACTLRDWMIHVRCRTSWPHIAYVLCRECLLRAAMTALRLRIGQSTSQ